MKKYLLLGFVCIGILSGCASVNTQYYRLPDSGVSYQNNSAYPTIVKVSLPEYMNTSAMVYQLDDVTLNFSQQNLWAQPLKEGVAQSLINKLNNQRLSSKFVLPAQVTDASLSKRVLVVTINQFYGRFDGHVIVSGFFQIQDQNQRVMSSDEFHFQIPQNTDGYAAMVRALDAGLNNLATQIANKI